MRYLYWELGSGSNGHLLGEDVNNAIPPSGCEGLIQLLRVPAQSCYAFDKKTEIVSNPHVPQEEAYQVALSNIAVLANEQLEGYPQWRSKMLETLVETFGAPNTIIPAVDVSDEIAASDSDDDKSNPWQGLP